MTTESYVFEFQKALPQAHLTGSRFFGNAKSDSDYDFFVSDDDLVGAIETLSKSGLKLTKQSDVSSYSDLLTLRVYTVSKGDIYLPIHLQVVSDLEWRLRAQNLLDNLPYALKYGFLASEKSERKHIWNWALKLTKTP